MMEALNGLEILCWGDGLFLWRVLNALAMLSGSGNLATLALIGCLFGLIIACVRAIMTGGREFPIVSVFLGAILYAALFAPTTRVIIVPLNITVDRSNISDPNMTPAPGAMVVDHVPLGAALTGYIMSQFGVQLTSMFETAFSTPQSIGVTNGGLAKNLSYITSVRLLAEPYLPSVPSAEAGASAEAFYNWRRSLSAYIHDCTMGGLNSAAVNKPNPAKIFTDPDPLAGIKFESDTWHTVSYAADGAETRITCKAAHTAIATNAEARLSGAMNQLMTARYGVATNQGVQALQDSLGTIGAHASTDVQKYMQASVVNALWNDALLDGPRLSADVTGIIALRQAEEQRTSDWVGGANLFLSSLRPVLAFFEALTYAVAPFLVFMLGLGERGWKVVGSYFMLALWVQLWLPLLAVSNLFLMTGMEHVAAGLGSQGTSVVDMNTLHTQALHWLGIGALFVQTTPFLALAVLYGGAYTATALAGRMTGQDYYNEKIQAPDAVQPAPVLQMGAMNTHTVAGGVVQGGAPLTQFTSQQGREAYRSSTEGVRASAMETAMARLEKSVGATAAWSRVAGAGEAVTQRDTANVDHSNDAAAGKDTAQSIGGRYTTGTDVGFGNQTGSGTYTDANLGPSTPLGGAKAGHRSNSTDTQTSRDGSSLSVDGSTGTQWKTSEGERTTVARAHAMANESQSMLKDSSASGLSASETAALSRFVQDVKTADKVYEEGARASEGWSASKTIPSSVLGETYLATVSPEDRQADATLVSAADPATYNRLNKELKRELPDAVNRQAVVTAMMLGRLGGAADGKEWSDELEARRDQRVAAVFPSLFAGARASQFNNIDPDTNRHLQDEAPNHGDASAVVGERVLPASSAGERVDAVGATTQARVAAGMTAAAIAASAAPRQVDSMEKDGLRQVQAEREVNAAAAAARQKVVVAAGEQAVAEQEVSGNERLNPMAQVQKTPDDVGAWAKLLIPNEGERAETLGALDAASRLFDKE